MAENADLCIVGAGPAGMSAAITARQLGLTVEVIDEQPAPGGQIYRNVDAPRSKRLWTALGSEYHDGRSLTRSFLACGARYRPATTAWHIDETGVAWAEHGRSGFTGAKRTILAVGAMERPFAVEGWTLPGVASAGAAQILLKTAHMVAEHAVFVGTGPLLYLVVSQYLAAGVPIRAVIDTTPPGNWLRAAMKLPAALKKASLLRKGLRMLLDIRRSGVPIYNEAYSVRLKGQDCVRGVTFSARGITYEIACDHVFMHQGIVPNLNASMSTRCEHDWDPVQLCWHPVLDEMGRTSKDWLIVAGDGGGIAGATAARHSGALAAHAAARDISPGYTSSRLARSTLRHLNREKAPRGLLDSLYRPSDSLRIPEGDEVIICRCEEIPRRELAKAVAEGCVGPNQAKFFTRAGMGPCQGRMCGHSVCETIASLTETGPAETGYYRGRSPVKPITIGTLAG